MTSGHLPVFDAVGVSPSDGRLPLPFPDSRSMVFEDCGHMVHFEAPRELAKATEEFLTRV